MNKFDAFERVTRSLASHPNEVRDHPFEIRNLHPDLPGKVRKLFDDGHYTEATFQACKYLDTVIGDLAPGTKSGENRMMQAFNENNPIIRLNKLSSESEIDEQRGYRFLFAGAMIGIRNPRGHDASLSDDPETCLDHLALISFLLRRLNLALFQVA